jgi:hypothetical protein
MLVKLPNGNDGLPVDVNVLHYYGIRGSKLALDAVVSGLFGVSIPPSPGVALRRHEEIKFENYSEGVRSRPDIRFIPFAVAQFGALSGHATALWQSWPSIEPPLTGCMWASSWPLGGERFLSPTMSLFINTKKVIEFTCKERRKNEAKKLRPAE